MPDEQMPPAPGPDHIIPPDGRPEPDPFDFDFEAAEKRHHLRVRDHWNDTTAPWPLERLREYTQLSDTLPGHTDEHPRWQESNARVADIRAAFTHIAHLESQISEARTIAESLYAFLCRGADCPNTLEEFNADLEHALLPKWLTGEPDASERWQTPHADEEARRMEEADIHAGERDPDYGKDLDYDDEDERTTDADYAADDDDEPFEPDENDPNGGWTL